MVTLAELQAKVAPATLASRDEAAITAEFNADRKRVVQKLGGIGLVLETLGPTEGANLLDALEAQTTTIPALKWAWVLINRGELDFGSTATRVMIDTLVPEPARTLLKAVAEIDDPVDVLEVRRALWANDGSYLA